MQFFKFQKKINGNKIIIIDRLNYRSIKNLENKFNLIFIIDNKTNRKIFNENIELNKIKKLFFLNLQQIDLTNKVNIEYTSIKKSEKLIFLLRKKKKLNLNFLNNLYFSKNTERSMKKYLISLIYEYEIISFYFDYFVKNNFVKVSLSKTSLDINQYLKNVPSINILPLNKFFNFVPNKILYSLKLYQFIIKIIFNSKITFSNKFKNYYLINIYNSGFKLQNKYMDISADWIKFKKKENDFLYITDDYLDKNFINEINYKKYNFYSMHNPTKFYLNFKDFFKIISIIRIIKFQISYYNIPDIVSLYYARAFIYFIKWELFLSKHKPKTYISYQNNNELTYLRNIILNNYNCKTVFYEHTANNHSYYVTNKSDYPVSILNMYNNNNLILTWNNKNILNYKKCSSEAKEYLAIGPLWTNFFSNSDDINLFKIQNKLASNKKFISFFPTSLSVNSINNDTIHYNFLLLIEKLLNDDFFDEYHFLYKTKNSISTYIDELSTISKTLYQKLQKNERFFHIENNYSSIFLCRISNLVINMAFSSTFHEALEITKKTLFYDYKAKHKQSEYYKFNNLVLSTKDNLIKTARKLLTMQNNEINEFYRDFKKSIYYSDTLKLEYIEKNIY